MEDSNGTKEPPIDPKHPCQTPHRSFTRHYWIAVWDNGVFTNKRKCTTCGVIEEPVDRWEGQ